MDQDTLNILLTEDNPGDIRLIQLYLEESAHLLPSRLHVARSLSEAEGILARENIQVILLDLSLPDKTGMDTFEHVHGDYPHIPVIVLTGLYDDKVGIEAVKKGAQDFLMKGEFEGGLLRRSIQYAIERKTAGNTVRNALFAGQEMERNRLARDLHDGLGQSLSAIRMSLSLLNAKSASLTEDDRSTIENLNRLIQAAILDFRSTSHNLAPVHIEEGGLISALEEMCGVMNRAGSIMAAFECSVEDTGLDKAEETELYRITQELANNVIKHAGAGQIFIRLSSAGNRMRLEVEDDGKGISPDILRPGNKGIGLNNIASRVRLLNGTFRIGPADKKGTLAWIEMPSGVKK